MTDGSNKSKNDTDIELLNLYKQDGNEYALVLLFSRYQGLINSRISHFGFSGDDIEDLCQECFIGLYRAIFTYDSSKSKFSTFATLCIDRVLISEIRNKQRTVAVPQDVIVELNDNVAATQADEPQLKVEVIDNFRSLLKGLKHLLSDFEYSVFILSLNGLHYGEIAGKLGVSQKAVDNAMQRVRNKIKKI